MKKKVREYAFRRKAEKAKMFFSGHTNEQVASAREDERKVKAAELQLARLKDSDEDPEKQVFLEAVITGMDIVVV